MNQVLGFIHGDCLPQTIQEINMMMLNYFQNKTALLPTRKSNAYTKYFEGKTVNIERLATDPKLVIFNYLLDEVSLKKIALLNIIRVYLDEEMFSYFRNKLNDPIYNFEVTTLGSGIQFYFGDSSHPLDVIQEQLDNYINQRFRELDYGKFSQARINYLSNKWYENADFDRTTQVYWKYLTEPGFEVNYRNRIVYEVNQITYNEFRDLFQQLLIDDNDTKQVISNLQIKRENHPCSNSF